MTTIDILVSIAAIAAPLALWAWLSLRAAERMWRDDQEESAAPEGWDAVRRIDAERRKEGFHNCQVNDRIDTAVPFNQDAVTKALLRPDLEHNTSGIKLRNAMKP